jgi:hypothetical protein
MERRDMGAQTGTTRRLEAALEYSKQGLSEILLHGTDAQGLRLPRPLSPLLTSAERSSA